MPITNHVTNPELSRRLRELKVPQKSNYFWCQQEGQNPAVIPKARAKRILSWHKEIVSAYLASELGEFLKKADANSPYTSSTWSGWEVRVDKDGEKEYLWGATETECRAKQLIWLIENHLISVEELGK